MNHVLIGQIAGLLALIQIIPYIVSILRGHTKPERMSYFIWLVVSLITVSSYIAVGATTTIWTGVIFTFTGLLVLLLSIKHGIGGFNMFDIFCLTFAVVGAVLWVTTSDPLIALCFGTAVGLIGYLPTVKKVYFMPDTENTLSWSLTAAASILNLLALTTLQPRIALPVACSAITQSIVAYLLLFPKNRFVRRHQRPHKVHAFLAHPVLIR